MEDKYLKYSVEELVADDHFIQFILKSRHTDQEAWSKWLKRYPEARDKIEEASGIIKNLSFEKIDTQISAKKLWNQIDQDLKTPTPVRKIKFNRVILAASLAACLALLLLLRIVVDRTTTIATERSMTLTHLLPDQSEVKLNDDSKISYQKDSYGDTRKVTLSGEAFFEVRKGAPFIVETASGTVEVLGTSFNVFSHDNQFKVFCKTGRVRVKARNSEVILKPSEQTLLDRNKTLTQPARSEADVTWLSGVYKYENVPLTEVCSELERQFNIHVDLSKVPADLKYTGFFEDDNLDEALQSVFWPLKLDPIHQDGIIVIESTGH